MKRHTKQPIAVKNKRLKGNGLLKLTREGRAGKQAQLCWSCGVSRVLEARLLAAPALVWGYAVGWLSDLTATHIHLRAILSLDQLLLWNKTTVELKYLK